MFTVFPGLPNELKDRIWTEAAFAPHVVILAGSLISEDANREYIENLNPGFELIHRDILKIPAVLHTCKASRGIAQKIYRLFYEYNGATPFYFNPKIDTLVMPHFYAWKYLVDIGEVDFPIPSEGSTIPSEVSNHISIRDVRKLCLAMPVALNLDRHYDHYYEDGVEIMWSYASYPTNDLRYLIILKPSMGAYFSGLMPRHQTSSRALQRVLARDIPLYKKRAEETLIGCSVELLEDDYGEYMDDDHPYAKMKDEGIEWVLPSVLHLTLEELQEFELRGEHKCCDFSPDMAPSLEDRLLAHWGDLEEKEKLEKKWKESDQRRKVEDSEINQKIAGIEGVEGVE